MENHNRYKFDFHTRSDFDFKNVNFNTCIIIDEALRRGIKAEFVLGKYLELAHDNKKALFHISDNTSLSYLAYKVASSKHDTKVFLQRAGLPTPRGKRFRSDELGRIVEYANELSAGLSAGLSGELSSELSAEFIIKPDRGCQGRGVHKNVTRQTVEKVVGGLQRRYKHLIVEEKVSGKCFRFLATEKGYVCVTTGRPASVVGDGCRTIEQLIEEKNMDRQQWGQVPRIYAYNTIIIDEIVMKYLDQQGPGLSFVPPENQRVYLRTEQARRLGADGLVIPLNEVHPEFIQIAQRTLKAVPGMSYAGIDIITDDVSFEPASSESFGSEINTASSESFGSEINNYWILEINDMPGLLRSTYPYQGPPSNPAGALIDMVLPDSRRK